MAATVRLEDLEEMIDLSDLFLESMEEMNRKPEEKKPPKLYSIGQMVKDLGIDRKTVVAAEQKGIISVPNRTAGGHRVGYTLKDYNILRKMYGINPYRAANDQCLVFANQSFKGGVGKSVNTVCLSHGLAQRGYRVCVIDMDSQGTTTSAFGYIPDHVVKAHGLGIEDEKTVADFMRGDKNDLNYAIRDTNWDGLKLIPANLQVYQLEYELYAMMAHTSGKEAKLSTFQRLKEGIDSIKDQFDIIIIDSPPALGLISLNIMQAADSLLIPSPPRMYDFSSTAQFLRMLVENQKIVNPDKSFKWVKIMITQYDQNVPNQNKFVGTMRSVFKDYLLKSIFYQSRDIQNAASSFQSPYEASGVRKATLEMIELIVDEVDGLVRDTWSVDSNNEKFADLA